MILAAVQEEKLVVLTTEINAKQKCLEMLENARKRSDLVRQRYEERIKCLSERIQNAEDEKHAAVNKLSQSSIEQQRMNMKSCLLAVLFSRSRFVCTRSTQS
jgi:hypothetical protein